METICLNEVEVNVIGKNIEYLGRTWDEIDKFPMTNVWRKNGTHIYNDKEDWVVTEDDKHILYMNNGDGYMVLIEFEQSHYVEDEGIVIDKEGRILFTYF